MQVYVFDWQGGLWRLDEAQPTPYGFHLLRGKPPGGQPGRAEVILTTDLAEHLCAAPPGPALPMSQATIRRLRLVLGLPPPGPPDWPWEMKQRLRTLWSEGLPTQEIGRRLGTTKDAVIGQAHRLGLPPRESPIRGGRRGPRLPR